MGLYSWGLYSWGLSSWALAFALPAPPSAGAARLSPLICENMTLEKLSRSSNIFSLWIPATSYSPGPLPAKYHQR